MSESDADWEADEMASVVRWRRREALEAGMSRIEAAEYAESEINTQELRRLIEKGCPAELLASVLGCNVPV